MAELWVVLLIAGGFAATLGLWAWLGVRVRRRGAPTGAVVSVFDEIWHPSAHQYRMVIEVQNERMVPAPSPGDPKNPKAR